MSHVTRRQFLACGAAAGAATAFSGQCGSPARAAGPLVKAMPNAEKLAWRVGFAAYSFRLVTAFEAIDQIAATGLQYAELFTWQKLSPANPDAQPGPGLSKTLRKDLKQKASDCGVHLIGCYANADGPDSARALFEFAADMQFEFVVCEPPVDLLDVIEQLTEEYKVDLALHNHPQPSSYWNPETGVAALKGRSPRMGFCCDTGHWCRSGLDPVEMLRVVAPRVKTFHLKDLDAFGVRSAKDVIWGRGKGRIAEILAEVDKLNIKNPYFGIEWERDPHEPLETHAKSVAFFEKVAGRLAAS